MPFTARRAIAIASTPTAQRVIHFVLPLSILCGYTLWAFLPSRTLLPGIGDDPAFNAWHFLFVFRKLDEVGPWKIFSREIWNAPIFFPGELHLALSEDQLWPSLLLWPIWKLTGGLVLTMSLGLFALHFAAFFCAAGWLRARGILQMRFWGGLVFALCGWLQSHYAHWQNACIFVFPLALWSWERFRQKPDAKRLVLCAIAFGWIMGWNLYFAVLAQYLFAALLLYAWWKKEAPFSRLVLLGALSIVVQLPIFLRYRELANQVGQFAAWDSYPATVWSWLGRYSRPSFLEEKFRFWPRAQLATIEATGFVGFAWMALALVSLTRPRTRWLIFSAAIAYWISLGKGHGLFDLLLYFPGFAPLRAIGRFQIGVMAASLPAVFAFLEFSRGPRRWIPLGLVLLELWPAGPSQRVQIPQAIDGPPTPIEQALANSPAPILVVDDVNSLVQLALVRSGAPIFEGYTGRPTSTGDLLFELAVRRRVPLNDLLDLTSATRLLVLDNYRLNEARRLPRLRERGCYSALGRGVCLFDAIVPPADEARLRFSLDTELHIVRTAEGIEGRFFAIHPGKLDFNQLAGCRVFQITEWPFYTRLDDIGIEGRSFSGIRFERGGLVYKKGLREEWTHLPAWLRPKLSMAASCR